MGGQGGCEQRIEVFVKIKKKNWGSLGGSGGGVWLGGVRVDVIEELKFLGKIKKKKLGGGEGSGGSGQGGRGGGWVGGSGWWGVRVDVNEELKFL